MLAGLLVDRRRDVDQGSPEAAGPRAAMYLAAAMPRRTVVLLTGQTLGAVGMSIDLATALQPALVILEDVDLVAVERDHEPTNPILSSCSTGWTGSTRITTCCSC